MKLAPPTFELAPSSFLSANGVPASQPRATPWEGHTPRDSGLKARDNRCAVVPGFQPSRLFGSGTQGVAGLACPGPLALCVADAST